jgi:hypothetical protein
MTKFMVLYRSSTSAEALGGVLDGHPHLSMPGNSIEVLEMLSMPGM